MRLPPGGAVVAIVGVHGFVAVAVGVLGERRGTGDDSESTGGCGDSVTNRVSGDEDEAVGTKGSNSGAAGSDTVGRTSVCGLLLLLLWCVPCTVGERGSDR